MWVNDMREGRGILYSNDGSVYEVSSYPNYSLSQFNIFSISANYFQNENEI